MISKTVKGEREKSKSYFFFLPLLLLLGRDRRCVTCVWRRRRRRCSGSRGPVTHGNAPAETSRCDDAARKGCKESCKDEENPGKKRWFDALRGRRRSTGPDTVKLHKPVLEKHPPGRRWRHLPPRPSPSRGARAAQWLCGFCSVQKQTDVEGKKRAE